MADQFYSVPGFVILNGLTFVNGAEGDATSQLQWSSLADSSGSGDLPSTLIDSNDDGSLVVGQDVFFTTGFEFNGYTITGTDGKLYPVFSTGGLSIVPLPVGETGQTIIPTSGTSGTFVSATSGPVYLCFGEGTEIATPSGACPVEDLQIGDPVLTADGHSVPVKWIGRQTLNPVFAGARLAMVRIAAGAVAQNLPDRDLVVTADHGMILDGMVVNAGALVNDTTITWIAAADLPMRMTIYHVETEAHDVILANGASAETFIDYAGRAAFDNHAEYLSLYGAERIIPEMPMPRISSARMVPDTLKARLGRDATSSPPEMALSA